jgi:sugar-specific transcriptional regulator TrmB
MSLARVLKVLEGFGLSKLGAMVYIYLAKNGPKNRDEIANALKLSKNQLGPILKSLHKSELISLNSECRELFFAIMFEQLLDKMIALKDEEADAIKEARRNLLVCWRNALEDNSQANKYQSANSAL